MHRRFVSFLIVLIVLIVLTRYRPWLKHVFPINERNVLNFLLETFLIFKSRGLSWGYFVRGAIFRQRRRRSFSERGREMHRRHTYTMSFFDIVWRHRSIYTRCSVVCRRRKVDLNIHHSEKHLPLVVTVLWTLWIFYYYVLRNAKHKSKAMKNDLQLDLFVWQGRG